jgi:hypothetical protein
MRVTVGMIVGQLAAGWDMGASVAAYRDIEREDITQALRYAAWRTEKHKFVLEHNDDCTVPMKKWFSIHLLDCKRT